MITTDRVTMKSFRRTLMLMVLYLTVASTRKNGWAPRWMVNLLCTETSALTQVPWDCTGYLHCYTQGITTYGVWVNCPPNLRFDQISGNCLRFSPACVDMAKIAGKYCPFYPHLTFPHPESCAMFYDCSRKTPNVTYGLKIYENECPFPTLFSTTLETCTDNLTDNNVRCNNAPATKCDYRTECVIESRACVQDGYAPTPGTVLSPDYIECQAGKIKATLKCKSSSEIFDPLRKICTSNISQLVDTYCRANPTAKFSDPVNCARYYDCSTQVHYTGLNPYQSECQYLYLFEESSGTCILFYMMKTPCGKKLEPKAPCDYRIGQCLGRQYCMACSASCIGQPDGKVQYPGIPSTRYHLVCRDERTMDIQECAKGFIFDIKIRGCLPDVDEILTTAGVTTTASTTAPMTTSTTDTSTSTDLTTTVASTTTMASAGTTSTTTSMDVTSTVVSTTTTASAGTTSTTASTDVTSTVASTTTTASAGTASTTASTDVTSAVASTTTTASAGTTSTTASTDVTSAVVSMTTTVSAGVTSTVASTPTTATPVQDICPCENFTSLSERLDNLTSITSSLAEQLKATARSPFDCVAPPMPAGTVAQVYYEGPLAVARYTCAVKDEVFCAGPGVSRCAGSDIWSPVSRCGRAMWQNVTNNSITLDCPPSDQGSLSFTVEGLNDFRVELKEDEAILLSFRVNLTEGVLVVINGTGNATLTVSQRSSDTDWRINFNNGTLGLSLSGFKQDDVFFPPTNFSGVWMLTVTGDVELKEVRLTTPGTPVPVPRGKSGAETGGAIDSVNTVNRALNQPVFASAYMNSLYKLETVVDGNNDNNVSDNHCFMTAVMEPWVMVDLGSLYHVTAIILTRSDSFESRLRDIEIVVYTQNPEVIPTAVVKSCASKPGQLSYQERIQCTAPVIGRFVRVQYMAGVRDILTVCEMEVYGADVTGWSPFLCPDPPLLDKSMVDVHYSLTAAVAVYSCDDGYSGGCDDNNLLYCTSAAGWEGRPQTCIKVDAGTENTVGRVEIPCPLQIGFAHELWLEWRESGSYILFQAGTDVLLMINIKWAQGGAEVTFRHRIDGRIAPIEADTPVLFKNGTLAHVVVLFLSDYYQFLVDTHPLIAVPHMTSSPNIDLIDGTGMFIKRVTLNQDWRQRVVKDNYTNYSFNKSTFATSNLLASDGAVDGNVTYTTLSSTCWQAAAADEAPYWQVDTGGYYHIKGVMLSARSQDGCSGNCDSGLHDFALDLYMTNPSSDPDAKARLCQFYNGYIRFSTSEFIQCRGDPVGRYVVLRATRKTSANDLLTVCEVEVWGLKSVMKAVAVSTWTPRDCPMPPVLENMSVKISYTLNASIATYMCDGNYTVCSDYDNVLRCEGELGWKGEPAPCVKAVENVSGENSSVIFGCSFKLGTRIEAWLKPNGSIPDDNSFSRKVSVSCSTSGTSHKHMQRRYQVSLETKNSSEVIIGLGFDSVSSGKFLTRYTGSPEQATSIDFAALQRDAEYHFVFTFYSDSIQATVDGVLIWNYPHYQMSHRIGSLAVAGLSIRQIGVTMNRDTVKQPIPSNLALNKTATSSTNGVGAEPGGMVDGDPNKTCWSHAENDTDALWEVDLQGYYYIRDIVVTSSTCSCDTKPHDFEISVSGHSEEDKVCYLYQGDMEPETTERLVCGEEVLGRYVKIVPKARRDNSDLLTLCEVEVYGSSLKPSAWSPFHCGPPPVEEESVTSLAYSATQAVATYTCRDNYTTCDDVNSTVMTCSSGQRWKGTPIKCVQNVFEYTDTDIDIFDFRNTCDFTVFSSLEVWATPSPQGAKFSLEIENTTIAFTVELNSNDSTLIGSVDYGSRTTLINTSLSTPGPEHHLVFTVMPDIIRIEVDKTEMTQVPHLFESLKIDCLRFENISTRMIKMSNGNLRGVHKVPLVQNMALRKRAESSTGPDPGSVVDGSQATCWETTSNDADSWWQVDLQGYYYVKSVGISHVTSCTACERYRHDFQVEVYKTNPQVYPESDVSSCYTYLAVVPARERTTMDCLSDSFGRYVRIKRVTTPRPDDVMALCEVEVFVSKPVKGDAWTPFSCPQPPLADLNPLRMSYTATEAMATYQCQEGFSVCAGSDVIKCNSSAGWPSRDMPCRQTTFEVPGDFLTSVDVQCPLTVGDVLESWVSSKERMSVLMLQADSQTQFALVYEMSPRQWYVSSSTNAGEPLTKYVDNSPLLIPGQEWHVVMAFLSEHIHIEINGRPLVVYPHYIPLSQVRVVTSIIGFKLRKVSVSKWRHAILEAPLTNLAHDRTSTASSNVRTAMLVVDGNDRNDWMSDSCWSAVKSSDPAWWQVDLGGYYVVSKIQVSSIQMCDLECSWTKRLHDFSIDVFMDDPTTTEDKGRRCYTYDGLFPSGTTQSLVCQSSIPGRYTRLTRHKVRPQDEFTVCEVQVYGNKVVKKNSGSYDCVLPPPHLDGATSDVQYTETRMQAIYSCKTGYAPCGLEPPTCACAGGIWQAIRGSCYRSAYRYPPVSSKSLLLNCPLVYSTSVHIFATPTLGKDMYISLRHHSRGFLTLRIFFNHKDYQNVTRVSNNKEDIQADVFPFVIGEEFHLMISYFTDYFNIEVNSVPLVTAVSSTVHDGIVADVAFSGPMAVRELRFDMPDEKTYYKDIHAKPHSRYKFVDLPITTTQTTKYFRVKACKDVVIDVKGGLFLEDHVQFTLGARENTKTDCTVCPEQKSIWHSPLSCDDYRTFWLDWSNGLDLKLGEGSVIGAGFIMQAPVSSAMDQIRISGTTNVINIEHPETCGSPEAPPLNMVIDKYQRESRISTSVTYTCVDQNYMFCGEDNVANCTMGVVGNEVKGECRKMTWHPKERNFTAHWPCKVTEGSTLSLYLTENGTFSLHFGDFRNILLQIDASFANETFTVGHRPKSATETKSEISSFPFTKNKKFHLTVMLSNSLYKISVDDTEVASYNDTFDYSQVAYVFIQADKAENVRIFTPENGYKDCSSAIVLNGQVQQNDTSVGAEGTVTCHAGHSFCGTLNKVTCWSDGTWRFNAPLLSACQRNTWTEVTELTQDTDFGVPCELKSSDAIKLKAVLGTNSAKFQMQLLADKEVVLLIKYVVQSSSLTASRVLGGRTTLQETIQNHGFNTMDIDLTVDVTPTAFNISVNGVIMSSYPYESPLSSVKFISISQGTRIDSLTISNSK